jgi:hypothetical protein
MDRLKKSDSIDDGGISASAGPYQSDPEGEPAESPEQAAIDYGLDVADPSSGCDDPVATHWEWLDANSGAKAAVLISTDPRDGRIEKIRLAVRDDRDRLENRRSRERAQESFSRNSK